jgi:hypothetical protein
MNRFSARFEIHYQRQRASNLICYQEGWAAVTHEDGWPSMGLRFRKEVGSCHWSPGLLLTRQSQDEAKYLAKLLAAANGIYKGKIDVYTPETMPERWHFSHGRRIAPIYVVPKMDYALTNSVENGEGMSKGVRISMKSFIVSS